MTATPARRYLPGSMVLETTWKTRTGWLVVRDALAIGPWHHDSERAHGASCVSDYGRVAGADSDAEDPAVVAGSENVVAIGVHGHRANVGLLLHGGIGTQPLACGAQCVENSGIVGNAAIFAIQAVDLERQKAGSLRVFQLEDRERQRARGGEVAQPERLFLGRLGVLLRGNGDALLLHRVGACDLGLGLLGARVGGVCLRLDTLGLGALGFAFGARALLHGHGRLMLGVGALLVRFFALPLSASGFGDRFDARAFGDLRLILRPQRLFLCSFLMDDGVVSLRQCECAQGHHDQ